ncbi:MAG TPA: histidine phosphatase family protein [Cytophagales bacterium]|nr:histidine phosphatase family protein [Cytophagales bacterium]
MTKILYLLRHAKSDWSVNGQKDFDRELNQRGYYDAPIMGVRMYELNVRPEMIFCSPAKRTVLTCEYVCERIQYNIENVTFDEDLYEASSRTLLQKINTVDDQLNDVMFIGHNPTHTYIAEYLTGKELGNIPTSGCLKISFEIDSWAAITKDLGKLEWFIFPKDNEESEDNDFNPPNQ